MKRDDGQLKGDLVQGCCAKGRSPFYHKSQFHRTIEMEKSEREQGPNVVIPASVASPMYRAKSKWKVSYVLQRSFCKKAGASKDALRESKCLDIQLQRNFRRVCGSHTVNFSTTKLVDHFLTYTGCIRHTNHSQPL